MDRRVLRRVARRFGRELAPRLLKLAPLPPGLEACRAPDGFIFVRVDPSDTGRSLSQRVRAAYRLFGLHTGR